MAKIAQISATRQVIKPLQNKRARSRVFSKCQSRKNHKAPDYMKRQEELKIINNKQVEATGIYKTAFPKEAFGVLIETAE